MFCLMSRAGGGIPDASVSLSIGYVNKRGTVFRVSISLFKRGFRLGSDRNNDIGELL